MKVEIGKYIEEFIKKEIKELMRNQDKEPSFRIPHMLTIGIDAETIIITISGKLVLQTRIEALADWLREEE